MNFQNYEKSSKWNLSDVRFLYPPDDFVGKFTNEHMQKRHEKMQEDKINVIFDKLEAAVTPEQALMVLHPQEHVRFLQNNLLF